MKRIFKKKEPKSLSEYRSSISHENLKDENIYEEYQYKTKSDCNIGDSNNLRLKLLEEQGYICCYCMSRVDCNNSKIEHLKPQSKYRNLQIDYQNLFISCKGGEGEKANNQHCDTKKAEKELKKIDLLSNIQDYIYYKKETQFIEIDSKDRDIKDDLDLLNLNISKLKRNRRNSYDNLLAQLQKRNFKISSIKKALNYYKNKHNGKYEPYCEMIVYFLTKKLKSKGINNP